VSRRDERWPTDWSAPARLRGGFFHSTIGYSLPDAVRNAVLLTLQPEMTSAALPRSFGGARPSCGTMAVSIKASPGSPGYLPFVLRPESAAKRSTIIV
jgi:hypothetical protein